MARADRLRVHTHGHIDPDPADQTRTRTNAERADPTLTTGVRESYAAEAFRRFRDVKGLVRETVEENDALRLGDRSQRDERPASVLRANASARDDFRFETRADKESAFQSWFQDALDEEVLEPVGTQQVKRGGHWTAAYVRAASKRGLKNAHSELKPLGYDVSVEEIDAAFGLPTHQDTLRSLHLRNYKGLEGITDAVDKEVSRVLSEGMAEGVNPREMASRINDRVDKIGITRARTLARTETVHAANEAALTRYEEMGVDEVGAKVEHLTAQDSRVCEVCRALEGNVYTISEAHGRLPVHPSCRCSWKPII